MTPVSLATLDVKRMRGRDQRLPDRARVARFRVTQQASDLLSGRSHASF